MMQRNQTRTVPKFQPCAVEIERTSRDGNLLIVVLEWVFTGVTENILENPKRRDELSLRCKAARLH